MKIRIVLVIILLVLSFCNISIAVDGPINVTISKEVGKKIARGEEVIIWNGTMYSGREYKYSITEVENLLKEILERHEERLNNIEKRLKIK